MAIYDIHPREISGILEGYLSPQHLRPVIASEPRLAPFLDDFDDLASALAEALAPPASPNLREGLRARRDELIERHDVLLRQTWFLLQAARTSEEAGLAERAERAEKLLLPEGRAFIRRGHFARVAEARRFSRAFAEGDLTLLRGLRAPGTQHLLDLHEARLVLAEALDRVLTQLREAEAGAQVRTSMRELRARWSKLLRLFVSMVEHMDLGPEPRGALLGHLEGAAARVARGTDGPEATDGDDDVTGELASAAWGRRPPAQARLAANEDEAPGLSIVGRARLRGSARASPKAAPLCPPTRRSW